MKVRHLFIPLALGLGVALALLGLLSGRQTMATAAPTAGTRYVATTGDDADNDCTSHSAPCRTVQHAVDVADPGETIKIATGTYQDVHVRPRNDITSTGVVTQLVYITKAVSIHGGYTTADWTTPEPDVNLTTLDAQGQGRVLYVAGDFSSTVEGLRITGGDAAGMRGCDHDRDSGGGVYVITAALTLKDNWIYDNRATQGAGLARGHPGWEFTDPGVTLNGNTLTSNVAEWAGGGIAWIYNSYAELVNNTITENFAGDRGGGLYGALGRGLLERNIIHGNTAGRHGGGLYLQWSGWTLTNNLIADNHIENDAWGLGSGLHVQGGQSLHWLHNTIVRNSGGDGSAVYVVDELDWGRPTLWMTNTILADQPVGLHVAGTSTVTVNGVLWHDMPVTVSQSPTAVVSVQNEHVGDPAFVDPAAGDYHIGAASAARDAGIDAGADRDMDGQVRPMGRAPDIGADEFPGAHLAVENDASLPAANGGQEITYTVAITSDGEMEAVGVVLTDTLGPWQRVSSAPGDCTIADPGWGSAVVCGPYALARGEGVELHLTAEVSTTAPPGEEMVSAAHVSADETMSQLDQVTVLAQDCHARVNDDAMAYTTVQQAVDAASPGDTVKVAGTCVGVHERGGLPQQVVVDKEVSIQGGYTTTNWTTPEPEANPTTLDAHQLGRVLHITGTITPTIEGLRITGGDATGRGVGGGIYVYTATATISNCVVYGNTASRADRGYGGGLFLSHSDATLSDNVVQSNTASTAGYGGGGGLCLIKSDATLSRNTVRGNTGSTAGEGRGGGLFLYSSGAVLKGNGVEGNVASTASDGVGGGLHFNDCRATLIENRILENTASTAGSGEGGGLRFVKCTNCEGASVLIGNIVRGNVASTVDHGLAGGVQIGEGTLIGNAIVSNTATLSPTAYGTGGGLVGNGGRVLTLTNNLVTDNHATEEGSGMHIMGDTSGRLLHNTIVNNHGGASGVEVGGGLAPAYTTLMFTNTIIAGHANFGIRARQGNTVALEATLWGSGAWANGEDWGGPGTIIGAHNYWGDPAFVDPAAGDYHIRVGSDARDAGVDAGVTTDIDGEPRPTGLGYDIGADEFPVALTVTKRAHPDPVEAGERLTYTLGVTNTGNVDLHAIITDTLPAHVTPSGTFTWTPTIPAPGGVWMKTVIVTVEMGYAGLLTNTVRVVTDEGASGTQVVVSEAEVVSSYVYLPLVLRGH